MNASRRLVLSALAFSALGGVVVTGCSKEPDKEGATDVAKEFFTALNAKDIEKVRDLSLANGARSRASASQAGAFVAKYGGKSLAVAKTSIDLEFPDHPVASVPMGRQASLWQMNWAEGDKRFFMILFPPIMR